MGAISWRNVVVAAIVAAALIPLAAWPAAPANACSLAGFPSLAQQPAIAVPAGSFEQPSAGAIHFRVEDGLRSASPAFQPGLGWSVIAATAQQTPGAESPPSADDPPAGDEDPGGDGSYDPLEFAGLSALVLVLAVVVFVVARRRAAS